MSIQSDRVKAWRKATKKRIIDAMGGKCQCCGYNTCHEALELHHVDPTQKEFSFGGIRANPKAWETIVIELRKSVLLCAICHREIHAGYRELPSDYEQFNEEFADYRKAITEDRFCNHCETKLTHHQKSFCSQSCNAKHPNNGRSNRYQKDWSNLYQYKFVDNMTNVQIAEIIGCSETSVRKQLSKLAPRAGVEPATGTLTVCGSTN